MVFDPYARGVGRATRWGNELFAYRSGDPRLDLAFDRRDSAKCAALGLVIDPAFDWEEDRPPLVPWQKSIIYELHVKGFTALHPEVRKELRGTYAGLASEPAIRHLKKLGVTAVELMPVHQHSLDRHLAEVGLTNFWGYNTLGWFAPDIRFSSTARPEPAPAGGLQGGPGDAVREFKTMVRALHREGIEVILDVVYNHTAEGGPLGPTLSLRGIDNKSYYLVRGDDPRAYVDYTGCGNTLNMKHPRTRALVLDSLRYWVEEMHVDGFRFDLAPALARGLDGEDALAEFYGSIRDDAALSGVKWMAEPWDTGPGGYRLGHFPHGWSEWNGRYRDAVRRFWRGDAGSAGEFATRLAGSSDLFGRNGRTPQASINYVTVHDGFTLEDVVSYSEKRNEANQEKNADGDRENFSSNGGVEGPSRDPHVRALRQRQKRNLMATLLLSQGVPLLSHGDELGRTQKGNNNAYCHDSPLTWVDWDLDEAKKEFLEFVTRVIRLRKDEAVIFRTSFFEGVPVSGTGLKDITWLAPSGREMTESEWADKELRCLGALMAGQDQLLILANSANDAVLFHLPPAARKASWHCALNTARPAADSMTLEHSSQFELAGHSLAVFRMTERLR